jgi:hypothetical protein
MINAVDITFVSSQVSRHNYSLGYALNNCEI